ncbi:MAG: pyruvate dehydrogenase (acetyl-transferring), homodimeric type, partial [Acidimicrobiia bacterium]|nr:pyruvate dehydrogenase (acetyl-transferring), homodimeric type [Acidimicrobiia bacterium]
MAGDPNLEFISGFVDQIHDVDPTETNEWIESLDAVVAERGSVRARYLLSKLVERAHQTTLGVPGMIATPYINTIPPEDEPAYPGDEVLEKRIRRFLRWNAAVMVIK